jgi:hypothetical protein
MTPREAMREARSFGLSMTLENQWFDGRLVFGFQISEAVWYLVHDIRISTPPSAFAKTPSEKHAACIKEIRRMGF